MPTNDRLVCVYGIRRTGNHALITWMMNHLTGRPQVHLNDIHLLHRDPYRGFTSIYLRGLDRYTCRRKRWGFLNRHVATHLMAPLLPRGWAEHSETQVSARRPKLDVEAIRRAPKHLLLLSYEDVDLENPRLRFLWSDPAAHVGTSGAVTRVLVLRDPYNLFASLLRAGRMTTETAPFYVRLWKQHAHHFARGEDGDGHPLVPASYNAWCRDAAYRVELGRRLGFSTDGGALSHVPSYGGGSSFQGTATPGETLQTETRWQYYCQEAWYRDLFDDELRALARELFAMPQPF